MGVSIIIPPMSQPSMGPCPRHSLRHFLSVLSHRAFHAILNRTCPLLLPFPTPALTAFYNECVLGRGLPGDKVGVLLPSVLPRACGTAVLGLGTGGGWGGGSCLESSRACASFCRMRERATQTWNTGGWLLALCLTWLWTRLASASLQPPTPTGLGEVVGPTPGGT